MKYVKMLGLAAVAALALMAFVGAGTASATVLCKEANKTTSCPNRFEAGQRLEATTTPETTAILKTTGGVVLDTCTGSVIKGEISNPGSKTETVSGPIDPKIEEGETKDPFGLIWGSCSRTTDTLKVGSLEVHHIAESDNGTLTATGGIEVTINTIFGSCVFGTGESLKVGKITGGNPATINTENTVVPKISGNAACPAHGVWDAKFTLTEPGSAWVSAEQ